MSDSESSMPEHPPVTDWAHDFDHTDPRWTENPFPIWAELPAASPVVISYAENKRFSPCSIFLICVVHNLSPNHSGC
jgi:hypothetical protein